MDSFEIVLASMALVAMDLFRTNAFEAWKQMPLPSVGMASNGVLVL